jgi:hypothetical protein
MTWTRREVNIEDKKATLLIGDPRVLDENKETLSRKFIIERIPEMGETLKITIRSTNTRGRRR